MFLVKCVLSSSNVKIGNLMKHIFEYKKASPLHSFSTQYTYTNFRYRNNSSSALQLIRVPIIWSLLNVSSRVGWNGEWRMVTKWFYFSGQECFSHPLLNAIYDYNYHLDYSGTMNVHSFNCPSDQTFKRCKLNCVRLESTRTDSNDLPCKRFCGPWRESDSNGIDSAICWSRQSSMLCNYYQLS